MQPASSYPYAFDFSPPPEADPPPITRRRGCFGWLGVLIVGIAFIILLVAGGRALLLFAQHAQLALEFPYPLNYGEGPLLDQAARIARGDAASLYTLNMPPYTITNYPPLYPLFQAPFITTLGTSFFYGRVISLVSIALAALFLVLITRAITRDWLGGIAAGVLLLTLPYILHWSPLARIDSLALALSLLGLFCAAQFPRSGLGIFLAAVFCALAAYTRQTYLLAAPLAAFAYLWRVGGAYRAWSFAAWFGVLVLVPFAILLVLTEGGIFFHLITANVNLLDVTILTTYTDELARNLPLLLVIGALFLLFGWLGRRGQRAVAWALVAPYLLGGVVVALTIVKIGSDVNYLYELCAGLCLAAGATVAVLRRVPLVRALLLIGLAGQIVLAQMLSEGRYYPIIADRVAQRAEADLLYDAVRNLPDPVIADDATGMLVLAGKQVIFQPFEMSQLAQAGLWDETVLLQALENGAVRAAILYNPFRNPSLRFERWTPAMLDAINDHFRALTQRAESTVYTWDS